MQADIRTQRLYDLTLTEEELVEIISWYHEGHDGTKPSRLADQLITLKNRGNNPGLKAGSTNLEPVQIVTDPTQTKPDNGKVTNHGQVVVENPVMPESMQWIERA